MKTARRPTKLQRTTRPKRKPFEARYPFGLLNVIDLIAGRPHKDGNRGRTTSPESE